MKACTLTRLVVVVLLALGFAHAHAASPSGSLRVENGDFGDLSGLTAAGAGWYAGVPRGWESTSKATSYSVRSAGSHTAPVCNLSQLGFLLQEAGTLTDASDVVLEFDVADVFSQKGTYTYGGFGSVSHHGSFDFNAQAALAPGDTWSARVRIGAALLDGNRQPLVHGEFRGGVRQKLTARNVPAGTKVIVEFWMTGATLPALDNVSITTRPGEATPPPGQLRIVNGESSLPRGSLRLVNGDFSDLAGLSSTRGAGWYDGVPTGWRATASDPPYAVKVTGTSKAPICNVSQLGPLMQEAGTVTEASDVVLRFDVSDVWMSGALLSAALLDAKGAKLAESTFPAQRGHTLVAVDVPAGTTVFVRFAAVDSAPGLQNVSVTNLPAGASAASQQQAVANAAAPGVMGDLDAAFRDSPNLHRIIQFSRHDGEVLPIARMREAGIGGVMLFMSGQKYLRNEEAWNNLKTTIRLAKEAGMQVWMADDNGFPSGQAGGLVVAANPALELRVLTPVIRRGQGPEPIRMDLPSTAETFVSAMLYPEQDGQPVYAAGVPTTVSDKHVAATGLAGPWVLQAFALKVNNDAGSPAAGTAAQFGGSGHYPNLLNAAAVETFVETTHAEYARRLGSLTNQIDVFYTNEPHLGTTWHAGGARPGGEVFLPWVADMPRRFREDHGYDVMPFLPALFGGTSDEARLVRRHFHQTVGNIFAENYTGRIARWAEEHGVRSGGHLLLEERMDAHVAGYGNFFQALQRQQIPGCDVAMPEPGDYWNFWMPRLVASAAQLQDRDVVSVLIDPIVDRQTMTLQPSPEFMLRFINMAALMGANQFTSYVFWDRYPPDVYRRFNETVGRLCVMLTGARNVSSVAMYYPIETFQSLHVPSAKVFGEWLKDQPEAAAGHDTQENLARTLYQRGYDFSWLDADAVLCAQIRDGRLMIGPHAYTSIIMPRVELLPLAVLEKLQRFEAAGGKVLWVDRLPRLGDTPAEHAQVRAAVATSRVISPEEVVSNLGPAFPEDFRLRLDGKPEGLFITRWLQKGRRVNFVVNAAYEPLTATLRLEGRPGGTLWVYDPADGGITTREATGSLTLPPNSSVFLIEHP